LAAAATGLSVQRKRRVPQVSTFFSRSDAEKWGRLIESEIDRGIFLDRSEAESTTIGQLIDRYIEEVTPRKKSAKADKQCLLYLKRFFGLLSPAALQSHHIAAWRDRRLKEGRAGSTVIKRSTAFST
jgi:hypothetical protein